ncbi:MAG: 4Fe-4S binding protein [Desulfosalsimonadaceae bacterium]
MGGPYWIKTLINKTFSGRFFLSGLTRHPRVGRMVDKMLFEGDEIFYLPTDRVIAISETVDPSTVQTTAVPSMVLEHFIREADFRWIMDFCICRDSAGCKDYPVELGCLFLGEAARGINPKFGRPVGEAEALAHVARCRDAGLVHLVGRNKLDTVWLNIGPSHRLLTICSCCPCCCLWKVLPVIDKRISQKVTRMPGVRITVTDACVGCGVCTRGICFVEAIRLDGKQAVIDDDRCRGCGRCADACPNNAIWVEIDRTDYIEAAIARISGVVDVSGPGGSG